MMGRGAHASIWMVGQQAERATEFDVDWGANEELNVSTMQRTCAGLRFQRSIGLR